MPWLLLIALFLLLIKGFQWLQHLHLPLPVVLAGGVGLAVLSNSGLSLSLLGLSNLQGIKNQIQVKTVEEVTEAVSVSKSEVDALTVEALPQPEPESP
jgi:hypothetical protein